MPDWGEPHEHVWMLSSAVHEPMLNQHLLTFICGCGADMVRTLESRLTLSDDPPPGYPGMPLAYIERWLAPEDTTRPTGSQGA